MVLGVDSCCFYVDVVFEVGLFIVVVYEWVKKMVECGVIECFLLCVDLDCVGLCFIVFVVVCNDGGIYCCEVVLLLCEMFEVLELYSVVGEYDFLVKICIIYVCVLEEVFYKIKVIFGVVCIISIVVLNIEFEDWLLCLL